jgi:carbon monoxide dehydrogenase subunit G
LRREKKTGMAKIEASVMIDRPSEAVFEFMIDLSNAPKYDSGIVNARQTSAGALAVGTTFESKRSKEGIVSFRAVEYEPGRKLTLEVTSPRMMKGSKESIIIEGIEGKTRLSHAWDLKLGGLYRLIGPLVARNIRKMAGDQVSTIKRILESQVTS